MLVLMLLVAYALLVSAQAGRWELVGADAVILLGLALCIERIDVPRSR